MVDVPLTGLLCPACGGTPSAIARPASAGYSWRTCRACDLVFADPMRPADARFYSRSSLYIGKHLVSDALEWNHREFLRRRPATGGRLCDLGCGTGGFLRAARRTGYRVSGIDSDPGTVEEARRLLGPDVVRCEDVGSYSRSGSQGTFDVVTAFEVVEHVADPRGFLQAAKRLLRPEGLLVLSVPNRERSLDNLGAGDTPPNHLTRWSADTLKHFLRCGGFVVRATIVKPIAMEELGGGLARVARHLLARRNSGPPGTNPAWLGLLYRGKQALQRAFALPLEALTRGAGQGWDLYCEAVAAP